MSNPVDDREEDFAKLLAWKITADIFGRYDVGGFSGGQGDEPPEYYFAEPDDLVAIIELAIKFVSETKSSAEMAASLRASIEKAYAKRDGR